MLELQRGFSLYTVVVSHVAFSALAICLNSDFAMPTLKSRATT